MATVSALPCWRAPVELVPLENDGHAAVFRVRHKHNHFIVRIAEDVPDHHVSRRREAAAHRAAHAAGLAPRVVYAGEGALVCDYIKGRRMTCADLRRKIEASVMMLRRCHLHAGKKVLGETKAFWVFQVLRDYAHRLHAAGHPLAKKSMRLLSIADKLEEAQAPMRMVFSHNNLKPANFIDDEERLWLVDWEHAGFGTAAFDLANLSVNCGFSPSDDRLLLEAYFGGAASPDVQRSFAAMKVASSLRETLGATVSSLSSPKPQVGDGAKAAQSMKAFESLYAEFRERF